MRYLALTALAGLIACSGCSKDDDEGGESSPEFPTETTAAALANYADIVWASYADSVTSAQALDQALEALAANPSEATLQAAKDAWLASREPYLQTEVYRFYEGPIDNEEDGPEGLLNAWPLDENYIDAVAGNESAGIVNDTSKTIDAATLEGLNEQMGEKNIATGYHAIEFLLWGQDTAADGPGDRPYTDFVEGEDGTLPNADRRKQYLLVASDLLLSHLNLLLNAWADGGENYRKDFLAADPKDGLRRVLTGMIILSGFETGGERLQTALDSGDQEDEHSCFSDNTHRDMVQDVRGVQNVYLGRYQRLDGGTVSGTSIKDVVAAVNAELASRLEAEIADSLAKAEALQPPFDQEIALGNAEGRARVEALIVALRKQEKTLEEVFRAFELSVPVAE